MPRVRLQFQASGLLTTTKLAALILSGVCDALPECIPKNSSWLTVKKEGSINKTLKAYLPFPFKAHLVEVPNIVSVL